MKNLFVFVLLSATPPLSAQSYTFQVIQPFVPNGINDKGVVVGSVFYGPYQGVFRFNEFVTNLTDGGGTVFNSVNNQGEIVGYRVNEFGGLEGSFLLKRGVFQTVSVPGAMFTSAGSINNQGHIGGGYISSYGNSLGFILRGTAVEWLSFPLAAINDRDDYVENIVTEGDSIGVAVIGGVYSRINYRGEPTTVTGINNAGTVVGYGNSDAFAWKNGVFTPIHFPKDAVTTEVGGINNSGQITGWSRDAGGGFTSFIATPVR